MPSYTVDIAAVKMWKMELVFIPSMCKLSPQVVNLILDAEAVIIPMYKPYNFNGPIHQSIKGIYST